MPKLGESVQEATITKWFVKVGQKIEEDDPIFEVATDKVDSEIPSPVDGEVVEIRYPEGAKIAVGEVVAVIGIKGENSTGQQHSTIVSGDVSMPDLAKSEQQSKKPFLSPLVRSIIAREGITDSEIATIQGSGDSGRIRKQDILQFLQNREKIRLEATIGKVEKSVNAVGDIVEMSRMRKLIAQHMVESKHTAPHVTAFVEADVENLVRWRNYVKERFEAKHNLKLTYMPVFIEAAAKALSEFRQINVSLSEDKIIMHREINIGVAVATDSGDLIVPVIRNADRKNIVGLAYELSDLAARARKGKLLPDEIQGGTFTITNFGSFGNLMGTPIIHQPQSAILATGTIEKKPAVVETPYGDLIAVRHKMFLSLSYDHRIIDGALGGKFLKRIAYYLEQFNSDYSI